MLKAGKSARTMEYVFATFRAIWNLAQERDLVAGRNPVKGLKLPKVDNMRQRYLKPHEADLLLDALRQRSPITYQLALISLHTGMRFSEIAGLTWGAVDLERKQLHILRTKGEKARTVHMTGPVRGDWPNYGKLGPGRHHCHLTKGRPCYVAVWEERDNEIKLVEITYAGTREKAPY